MAPKTKQEVLEIVLAATVGDATGDQLARLSQLVLDDKEVTDFVLELLGQEAWLSWHGSQVHADKLLAELAPSLGEPSAPAAGNGSLRVSSHLIGHRAWLIPGLSAAALVGFGILVGGLAMQWGIQSGGERAELPSAPPGTDAIDSWSPDSWSPPLYVARFVHGTACVWGPGRMPPQLDGGKLRSGESINLMEGLAEIKLNLATAGQTTLMIEGPARMVLTAEGTPSLSLGKFSAQVTPGFSEVAFETPFGQIFVSGEASLGVAVYGSEVEVHLFGGHAIVASPWTSEDNSVERFSLVAGESLRLSVDESAMMTATPGDANPGSFAAQSTMSFDRLEIGVQYVDAVLHAEPILYWRFERVQDGRVPNEVADRFDGQVVGAPGWSLQGANRAIEFGASLDGEALDSFIESSDSLAETLTDSYSLEFWVKPSHYHLGSLVSFVEHSSESDHDGLHGMLLELGGPLNTPTTIEHSGRVRFLHRSPASSDAELGTSCFSNSPYELRRWEHVVAVKDGSEMRLYVNGEQVASADDNTKLPPNLIVIIGQLDRHRNWRRFAGQLDELAIYNRALSDAEIEEHFQLVRPRRVPRGSI